MTDKLKVKTYDGYSREWAEFIFSNRDTDSAVNIHNYDIVYGPIANDKVGGQMFNLREGYIDIDEFMRRLHYMKGITFQYAFCTQRAIDKLIKVK